MNYQQKREQRIADEWAKARAKWRKENKRMAWLIMIVSILMGVWLGCIGEYFGAFAQLASFGIAANAMRDL